MHPLQKKTVAIQVRRRGPLIVLPLTVETQSSVGYQTEDFIRHQEIYERFLKNNELSTTLDQFLNKFFSCNDPSDPKLISELVDQLKLEHDTYEMVQSLELLSEHKFDSPIYKVRDRHNIYHFPDGISGFTHTHISGDPPTRRLEFIEYFRLLFLN